MKQVITLLHWTELEYANFIYETGLAYLQHFLPGADEGIEALERSRIFWAWWKNHWQMRDHQFLHKVNIAAPVAGIREYYIHYNNPRKLAGNVWPNAVVLSDSYKRLFNLKDPL